jgi:hypothetical protein
MSDKITSEVFDLTIGDRDYTIEFDREGMKEADSMGVATKDGMGLYDRTVVILYAGLKMHHPFTTVKLAKKILDTATEEDGYTLDDFSDIADEFTKWYKVLFTESGESKKKIVSRREANSPKK